MTEAANHPARWWHALPDGRLQCDLCPRDCQLHDGQRGACFVRQRQGEAMILSTWGRSSGFCIDPIEKKPLHHFYPGSSVLSFGTAGCNLGCKFCQNWDISRARDMDRLMDKAQPETIARAARQHGALSVAYTYNDPVIFAEYAIDCAQACRASGIFNVAVSAGYIHSGPAREFFSVMDAVNIDLKAFSEDFYRQFCLAHLEPVLDTLALIYHDTGCWLEITTLLIPGCNDSPAEIEQLSDWIRDELGAEVPLHFSAFRPDWKMRDHPPTTPESLHQARHIARSRGLQHVYTGNIRDPAGNSTDCPHCQARLIERDGYDIKYDALNPDATCPHCGHRLAGHFASTLGYQGRAFGAHRYPIRLIS